MATIPKTIPFIVGVYAAPLRDITIAVAGSVLRDVGSDLLWAITSDPQRWDAEAAERSLTAAESLHVGLVGVAESVIDR